jgi:tetratricopeptide (TPR) repeat protein
MPRHRFAIPIGLCALALAGSAGRDACSQAAAPLTPAGTWYEHYERGVQLVEGGESGQARAELERALALRPEEGLNVPTSGPHFVDYLPHLFLAVACHTLGDDAAANEHLAAAQRSGMAAQSESGAPLLASARLFLARGRAAAPPQPAPSADPPARFDLFPRRSFVLDETEYARLREMVFSRCRIEPSTPRARAPWYFHYELGLALSRRGDHQRALDALIEAAQRKPVSDANARTYGMWFLDYIPYLRIAREHARLGNRECALDALRLAERYGEAGTRDHTRELRELKELLAP